MVASFRLSREHSLVTHINYISSIQIPLPIHSPDQQLSIINGMFLLFFFYQGFLSQALTTTGQQGKGGDHLLFYSTTSTRSRTMECPIKQTANPSYQLYFIESHPSTLQRPSSRLPFINCVQQPLFARLHFTLSFTKTL